MASEVINKQTVLFSSDLTTTADSSVIAIPDYISYITISSKTSVLIWLLDSAGNELSLLPSNTNGDAVYTFALLEIAGCSIKLKNDTSATSTVYVTGFYAG